MRHNIVRKPPPVLTLSRVDFMLGIMWCRSIFYGAFSIENAQYKIEDVSRPACLWP